MASTSIIVLDNSEWMRNSDFVPTRIDQQFDAFSRIADVKMRHPESMVGLMTMSGKAPKVLVTPSVDIGKLLGSLHGKVRYEGKSNVISALQIAQLALKHRPHKNHPPKIILFVGSPIQEPEDKLVKLGKQLQKNEVSVDIINFGENEENSAKLEAFLAAVNKNDNSHLVSVPAGSGMLTDSIVQSPIVSGGDGGGGGGGNLNEFGVDPELDPELAMAMAMSMEEARRAEETAGPGGEGGAADAGGSETAAAPPAAPAAPGFAIDDDDAELQAALAMSMEGVESTPAAAAEETTTPATADKPTEDVEMAPPPPAAGGGAEAAPAGDAVDDPFSDPSFVADVIGDLEGVDPNILNDPQIQAMMGGLMEEEKKDDEKNDGDK